MSIHGVLGESTSYPQTYSPEVLFGIDRHLGRNEIYSNCGIGSKVLSCGVDIWQAFELSWLNQQGISQVALARLQVPADSPRIVESKSLKLYLNSLNFSYFDNSEQVKSTIEKDVSDCVGAKVTVSIVDLSDRSFDVGRPVGDCIDQALDGLAVRLGVSDDIDDSGLKNPVQGQPQTYCFYSNLLRSNCPVTNQPDWGTLMVSMTTDFVVDYSKILTYVLSFRKHNGFHEQCVEQVFAHLLKHYQPTALCVQANYTRRGGIDINPIRILNHALPSIVRQARQ